MITANTASLKAFILSGVTFSSLVIASSRESVIAEGRPSICRSAQRLHPGCDGTADLVRRIFLHEMDSLDRHFGLRWQASGVFKNLAVREDSTRLGLEEQLRHTAALQPIRVGVHGRSYVGGIAFDRDFPRERQRRPPALAGLDERPAVLRHLL